MAAQNAWMRRVAQNQPGCRLSQGGGRLAIDHASGRIRRPHSASLLAVLAPAALAWAAAAGAATPRAEAVAETGAQSEALTGGLDSPVPSYGPPGATPGIPPDEVLEAEGAVIGEIRIDNQNIFDLNDPKDDLPLFRLANRLHPKTRAHIIRSQLLFSSGDRYQRRLLDESERILRAQSYFYDAWIRAVRYHDGRVDLRVTTRDVWTLNPGFNFGRSGGKNTTGVQLEEINLLGTGATVKLEHQTSIDRTTSQIEVKDARAFDTWTSVDANHANTSDGRLRELTVDHPFYALDTRWAGGASGRDDLQTDSLYDRGQIIDQFQDRHEAVSAYGGWSRGLRNGWVQRWRLGTTYDEHRFAPVRSWTGVTAIPPDRRFLYPWVEFDLVEDDYAKFWNHDQIARTEDFYLGTTASLRLGWADSALGSTRSALVMQGSAGRGFRDGGTSTLLVASTFSGRLEDGTPRNVLLGGSARYYAEQGTHWLFFTTLQGAKGWHLDLENQILLGGDSGLRGYPLRYQDGTARALWTIEQRYFTDWYPFRLFRVGGAVFLDTGRTWGTAPLAAAGLGLLTDAGFGLRFGNARSGLGNVVHVDLAFPFNGDRSIKRVQFLVQTEQQF